MTVYECVLVWCCHLLAEDKPIVFCYTLRVVIAEHILYAFLFIMTTTNLLRTENIFFLYGNNVFSPVFNNRIIQKNNFKDSIIPETEWLINKHNLTGIRRMIYFFKFIYYLIIQIDFRFQWTEKSKSAIVTLTILLYLRKLLQYYATYVNSFDITLTR